MGGVAAEHAHRRPRGRRIRPARLHTPELALVEIPSALVGVLHSGNFAADRVEEARRHALGLPAAIHGHPELLDRAWQLRHNVTQYDAVYAALAEALDCELVTCDARLARGLAAPADRVVLVTA